jgi:transcriptional regulator PpsR
MKTSQSKFWDFGSVPMIEPEYLGSILAAGSDIALFLKLDGKILSILVNEAERGLGNLDHWQGRSIREFLTPDCLPKFDTVFEKISNGKSVLRSVELNHQDNAVWKFPVSYSIHRVGAQDTVLMLGRDLRSLAETQQQLVKAQIAMERGYEESRKFDARFRMLLSQTRDAIVFLSASDGRIKEANAVAAEILGEGIDTLQGSIFASHFKNRRTGEFLDSLLNASESEPAVEIRGALERSNSEVRLSPSAFRSAGERFILCRLETDEQKVVKDDDLSKNLLSLYQAGSDAIVFTQANGVIEVANNGFLDLINAPSLPKIQGRSLANFLSRGQIDLALMLDNVVRSGQVRIYATEIRNEFGTKLSVEASVAHLGTASRPLVAFVIRDANRAETLRPRPDQSQTPSNSSIVELVGSATLKEIVGETNDMIEKMCIETAIVMTKNNRAAAAEMLGLSRQSLYVKLRKFVLIAKD